MTSAEAVQRSVQYYDQRERGHSDRMVVDKSRPFRSEQHVALFHLHLHNLS